MISAKKLVALAKKWKKMDGIRRTRVSWPRTREVDADNGSTSSAAKKGHFVVYCRNESCFSMPLHYLNSNIFRELFKMSEEDFGLDSSGPSHFPEMQPSMSIESIWFSNSLPMT